MNAENAIEVSNISKKFKLYHDKGKMLKEKVINWKRNQYDERWVLNGISFDIAKGEAVGLIGQNGCGKSTMLKLLTRIMYPDSGNIQISGRVSSLLELGAGFHPDLSGRENIYINASIFGLTRPEIDKKLGSIIAFSELEEFIDNPVRTYSSGMYMRLAFSVAINVNADILLIDEILAVGDVNFQAKCFNKLMEIKNNGTTIILVSHSTGQVEQLCDRSIWIQDGIIKMDGKSRDVHKEYLLFMGNQRKQCAQKEEKRNVGQHEQLANTNTDIAEPPKEKYQIHRMGSGEARIKKVTCLNDQNEKCTVFNIGETIKFKMQYVVNTPVDKAIFGLSIFRIDGVRCYGTNGLVDNINPFLISQDGEIILTFPNANLLSGKYYVDVCIMYGISDSVDYYDKATTFEVFSPEEDIGVIRMKHFWG